MTAPTTERVDAMEAAAHARIAARDSVIFSSAPTLAFDASGKVTIDDNVTMRRIPGEPDAADADVLTLAAALRTERAAREAAEGAIALLSRTLGCESDTPEGIVTEALDYAAEQRERAEAADDAVARAADADARSANLLMCGEAAERAAEEAHARHAALAGAVRERDGALGDANAAEDAYHDEPSIPGLQRLGAATDALREADVRLDALLAGAPGGYVPASLVREYLAALDVLPGDLATINEAVERERAARTALDAALAAAEGTR